MSDRCGLAISRTSAERETVDLSLDRSKSLHEFGLHPAAVAHGPVQLHPRRTGDRNWRNVPDLRRRRLSNQEAEHLQVAGRRRSGLTFRLAGGPCAGRPPDHPVHRRRRAAIVPATALCGARFPVRNRSDYQVTATLDVYGMSDRGTLQLPPRPSRQEFSATVFETTAHGTVRLFVGGKQVDVKARSAGACGS